MQILNKKSGQPTNNIELLLTVKEAKDLAAKLDTLLTPKSKHDYFEVSDEERKHKIIVVVPEHNNIEKLKALGRWVTSGPIYTKDTPQP